MQVSYTMVAEARGQRVLWYRMFGSYEGEWLLMSRDDDRYYLYRGSFGSCSGCDHLQGEFFESEVEPDDPRVEKFVADYPSFLEMKPDAALRIAKRDDSLLAVLPRNRREWYDPAWDNAQVGHQLALIVKVQEGAVSAGEIIEIDNQELRREAIERFGEQRFVEECGAQMVDQDGLDILYHIPRAPENFAFLYLKDGSSDRRYVLRCDPQHNSVQAARAASFRMAPEDFVLAQET